MRRIASSVAVVALLACRKETIDKPTAPDMADVVRAFDAPSGTFDQAQAAAVKSSAKDAIDGLVGLGLPEKLADEAKALIDKASSPDGGTVRTQAIAPRSFEGEGYGKVTRICDGWATPSTPDANANGSLALTLTFTDLSVDRVVWGTADRCKMLLGTSRVLLDRLKPDGPPEVRVDLGGPLAPNDVGTKPITIALSTHAQIDDKDVMGEIDVRITPGTGVVEVAVPVSDGDVVVTLSNQDVTGVRAKNGAFTCDPAGCKGAAGEAITW